MQDSAKSGNAKALERELNWALSLLVLKRAALKLTFLTIAAGGEWLAGLGFIAPLAALTSLSSMLAIALGFLNRERVDAPYYVYFDEAVWFFMLSHILRFA